MRKALALAVAAYAFSPIDLIPDFIPILGLADELVILPLGILLVVALIPHDVMAEHRAAPPRGDAAPRTELGRRRRHRGDVARSWRRRRMGSCGGGTVMPYGAAMASDVADFVFGLLRSALSLCKLTLIRLRPGFWPSALADNCPLIALNV